jgi:hypothetical protein
MPFISQFYLFMFNTFLKNHVTKSKFQFGHSKVTRNQCEGKGGAVQFKTIPWHPPEKTTGQNSFGQETNQAPQKHMSDHLPSKTIFSVYQYHKLSY